MGPLRFSGATFASAADGRQNNFDFLRFLFAALVLFYHSFALLPADAPGRGGLVERVATLAGGGAVGFFFVISGFLVTMSRQRSRGAGPFLRKRALRIYPGFLLASLFCAFLVGPMAADSAAAYRHHFGLARFALYLPLLPADVVGPDMSHVFTRLPFRGVLDGSFWTLRYEFELYLLTALLGALGLFTRGRGLGVALLFGLLYGLYAVSQTTAVLVAPDRQIAWVGDPAQWLRLSTCFLSGMTFYLYRDRIPASPALFGLSLLALLAAGRWSGWFSAALPVFGSYALFFFAFQPRVRLQSFARSGDLSYGLYLYAFPVQQLLILHSPAALTPCALLAAAFPLSLACAALSWHLVERPCLALKRGAAAGRLDRGDRAVSP